MTIVNFQDCVALWVGHVGRKFTLLFRRNLLWYFLEDWTFAE